VGVSIVDATALAAARWVARHGRAAGRGTDTLPGAAPLALPLTSSSMKQVGVLLVYDRDGQPALDRDARELLEAFAQQAALVLERVALADDARTSAVARQTDEMRASLLSAVSHDLRTPLAAITGAATTLRDAGERLSAPDAHALLDDIAAEALHLERLVESVLDMSRVDSGQLVLHLAAVPVDELVGSALARVESRLSSRVVTVTLPDELVCAKVDSVLFERVLVNLLENAVRHTPGPIDVAVAAVDGAVQFTVADRGPGFPDGVDVFGRFVRGAHSTGQGLGLSICKGLVLAHHGTIAVRARDGGGSEVVVRVAQEQP
jgi:two-component system sensor histidine kinase KdpD